MKKNAFFIVISVIAVLLAASCASTSSAVASEPEIQAPVAAPAAAPAGSPIVLEAPKAKLTSGGGEGIRLEAGGNVGYWGQLNDIVEWTFDVAEAGDYEVIVDYSAASSFAGAMVKITVGDKSLEWKAASTDDWTNYTKLNAGTLTLAAGSQTLAMQATSIKNRFVANVMTVTLKKK